MANALNMKIGFIGSCPAEQFVEHVYDDAPIYKAYRVNTISLMSGLDWPDPVRSNWSIDAQRRFKYESRKSFLQRLVELQLNTLVVDFTRDARMPVLAKSGSFISYGYEFRLSSTENLDQILDGAEIIEFGTEKYIQIYEECIEKFINFMNREMYDTVVIIVVPTPTPDYRGRLMSRELYFRDFIQWQMRYSVYEQISSYVAGKLHNCKMYHFTSELYSDDHAEYGASAVHYAPKCWENLVKKMDNYSSENIGIGDRVRSSSALMSQLILARESLRVGAGKRDVDLLHEVVPYLFNVARNDPDAYFRASTTPDDVINSFLWIMGRLPESFDTFYNHYAFEKKFDLRNVLLESGEFKDLYKEITEKSGGKNIISD